jgi:phage-related holin
MLKSKRTILLVIGVTAGLLGCVLMFWGVSIPYLALVCLFVITFVCGVLGFAYTIKHFHAK